MNKEEFDINKELEHSYYLSDYANRDWDGLVETFYKPRWEMFFNAVLDAFDAGEPFVNMYPGKPFPCG